VPFSRHSPLPELRAFVSLFRPLRVVPNSLNPSLHGLDALCIPHLFANCLSSDASHSSTPFAGALIDGHIEIGDDQGDTTLQNLVGDGVDVIARAWVDSARISDKLATMEPFLKGKVRDVVRRTLGVPYLSPENGGENGSSISILQRMRDAQRINACRIIESESDPETQNGDEDAHARTAKLLFEVAERSQMAVSRGMSSEQFQSCESPLGRRQLVEEGSNEDAPIQTVSPVRASTPQVSECGSQKRVKKGISRARTDSGLASFQGCILNSMGTKDTRLGDVDDIPSTSFCAVSHTNSLPYPSLHQSYTIRQDDDLPLTDLQNIPLARTGTERQCIRSRSQPWSLSRLQSPFPSSARSHFPNTTAKRRKVDKSLDAHRKSDAASVSPEAGSLQGSIGSKAHQVEKSTDAARQTGSTEVLGLDVDRETYRAQRRALRARSRAIEEKLRHALPVQGVASCLVDM
jgi:hypothetical protein